MAHVRADIRAALVSALTGLTTTGQNVYQARPHSIPSDDGRLPCLQIVTGDEDSEVDARGALLRTVSGRVIARMVGTDTDIQNTMDQVASEVETALAADVTLGGLAMDMYLASSVPVYDDDGDQVTGVMSMDFTIRYRTSRADPETAL